LLLACASPCLASGPKAPPDSLADSPDSWNADTEEWKLLLGIAYVDTLDAPCSEVLLAAETALKHDNWVISTGQSEWVGAYGGNRLVTEWKPIRNLIFRLLAGRSVARCFASVAPTEDGRTELTFQGGLAGRRDLRHSSMRGRADKSYRKAVLSYQKKVRAALVQGNKVVDARPGAPR
jgi:hypothetical protein